MKDEEYSFVSEVRDKKITARSASNRRTHTGKGGRVRFPSDNLSKKELAQMSGECKSYRLNDPMTWVEFKTMPDDLKCTYIKLLRQKFNAPDCKIADMFGISKGRLGLCGGHRGGNRIWDKDGFDAWVKGMVCLPEALEEVSEPFMEEDVAVWEDPNPEAEEPDYDFLAHIPVEVAPVPAYEVKKAIPNMTFEGDIGDVLETIAVLPGGAYAKICVSWEVYRGGADGEN